MKSNLKLTQLKVNTRYNIKIVLFSFVIMRFLKIIEP